MANERLSVFENTGDVDLSEFTPAADLKKPKPPREKVKAISEAARFPSREAPAPVPEPVKRKPRYHKTGRTASLSCRLMPAVVDKLYEIADREDWLVGRNHRARHRSARKGARKKTERGGDLMDHNATTSGLLTSFGLANRQRQLRPGDDLARIRAARSRSGRCAIAAANYEVFGRVAQELHATVCN